MLGFFISLHLKKVTVLWIFYAFTGVEEGLLLTELLVYFIVTTAILKQCSTSKSRTESSIFH